MPRKVREGTTPSFTAAKANLYLVQSVLARKKKDGEEDAQDPTQKPDAAQFDDRGKQGKQGQS
jgi:Ca-activated chloride channel family protein